MAGVKGKSGGARKNAGGARPNSGGARPGAGRPPKPPAPPVAVEGETDMLALLQKVALGHIESTPLQVRAAIAAVQYTHAKKEGGKKDDAAERAKQAGSGKFAPAQPPKLVAAGGKKV